MKWLARLFALVLALAAHSARAQDVVYVLERAEFVASDTPSPPPDDAPWQPASLPDNWYLSHSEGGLQTGWYRMAFDTPAPRHNFIYGLYLPRNSGRRLSFLVNGHPLAGNAGYGEPGARLWAPPLVVTVSPLALNPGRNVMHIRVEAVPELRQGLTRVYLATGRSSRTNYEKRYAAQITTVFIFGAAALLCGLLAAAFWLRERSDATLFWFAVTAFAWAAAAFPWLHPVLTPQFNTGPLAFITRFAYAAPMLVLCLRVAGRRWPRPETVLWAFTLVGLGFASLASDEQLGGLITCWSVIYLAALSALLFVLVRSRQGQRRWAFWLLAASLGLAVLLNAHDLAWWMGRIDYDRLQLAHFHVPLVLFATGATIVDRHFQAVAAVEQAKAELEGRVAEKAREIEANYARVQEAERERVLARERQRIMADMHDGLGSRLVGLLGAVQSRTASLPEVERRLHDALQEMRLAVDALEPTDGDLGVILGNVRHRMRAAIESSGVRFHWQVGELPQLSSLTPKAVLDIERIVLEALTNSLRHARAHDLTVSTRVNGGSLQVGISDNGIGFDKGDATSGRGLDSLRQRARALGGDVEIRSSPGGGTDVTLRLPLAAG